jgi:uncharacterized membrane protein
MLHATVTFANLVLAALVVGAMFGVWLGLDPAGLPAAAYLTQQQHAIRGLNVTMPALGAVTILLTVTAAVLARGDGPRLALLVAAAACFLAAGLVTRFLNQPINAVVMTWSPEAAPADWTALRDAWWRWHVLRTGSGLAGLCLLVAATVRGAPVH